MGNDVLRGSTEPGASNDTFVYDAGGPGDDQGHDVIVRFNDGLDVVLFGARGVTGFGQLDTNGNGTLDGGDRFVSIRSVTAEGSTRPSTVVDVSGLEGDAASRESLAFFDDTAIGQGDLVILDQAASLADPLGQALFDVLDDRLPLERR